MKRDKAFEVIAILLIVTSCLITIISSAYSVLRADDFGHAATIGVQYAGLYDAIEHSIAFAGNIYQTWQGTYFSMWLQAFLSPLNHSGLPYLRNVMVINSVLFFVSFLLFLLEYLKRNAEGSDWTIMLIIAMVLVCFMNIRTYTEVFYWYSGATSYCFPLSALLLALALNIHKKDSLNPGEMILCMILLIAAAGGTLMISGGACWLLLLFLYDDSRKHGKINRQDLTLFLVAFAGSLINAAAPGNYVRHSMIDSKIRIGAALNYSVKAVIRELGYIGLKTPALLFLGILFILSCKGLIRMKEQPRKDTPVFLLFLPMVVVFPFSLGYSDSYLPNRCLFLLDFFLIPVLVYCILLIGMKFSNDRKQKAYACCGVFIAAAGLFIGVKNSILQAEALAELVDGSYAAYYERCSEIYDFLEQTEEKEVVLNDFPVEIDNIAGFNLKDDPSYYSNVLTADWYQKDIIIAITQ
ncbi:MAG: DUF6056 family protein [Bulleidia sp.]|nr:DUF6056 family protein [Bulleidia sp.]